MKPSQFLSLTMVSLIITSIIYATEVKYKDGTYIGRYSFITVSLTIEEGRISDIKILEHGGGGEKYANMIIPLIDEIIERQSLDCDAVTGATVSSEYLKKALEDALRKAVISNNF